MHHLMIAIAYSVLVSAIVFAVIILTGNYDQWLMGLAVSGGILVVFCLAGLLMGTAASGKIHRRIRACDGKTAMESEHFIPCAKELSYGQEWLVYHKENTYLFWTKKNIHEIKVVSQKHNRCVLAVYSTLHPEGEAIHCSYDEASMNDLKEWLNTPEGM
jgi:hypothetical protein